MLDQLRRTRIKHLVEQIEQVHLLGDSVNPTGLLQQVQCRQPDIVFLDLDLQHDAISELASQINQRSPGTKIMMLDYNCRPADIFAWVEKKILGYATSDIDSESLRIGIASLQSLSLWVHRNTTDRLCAGESDTAYCDNKTCLESRLVSTLSEREKQVLKLLVEGNKNFAIAQRLEISPETIKSHMRRIMEKLAVRDRTQLVIKVLQQGAA